jgi:glucose/arabinose dehydrogenase
VPRKLRSTALGTPVADDQFGGPAPDDAHFTGVVLRLNADGSAPTDNPFYSVGAQRGGQVGRNLQKIWAYGVRNGFGLAVDPYSGNLWDSQNGEDSFDELNRLTRGANLGWVQIMGPTARYAQFRQIEATTSSQQLRWPMTRLASTLSGAQSRLFVLPGSHYDEPEFSWKYPLAPTGLGFLGSGALGAQYQGDLFVGFSGSPLGGPLFRFELTSNRGAIAPSATYLQDRVMDNTRRDNLTEGQPLLFGTDFGIVTDVRTAPNGNLLVVSLTDGRIYEIYRR